MFCMDGLFDCVLYSAKGYEAEQAIEVRVRWFNEPAPFSEHAVKAKWIISPAFILNQGPCMRVAFRYKKPTLNCSLRDPFFERLREIAVSLSCDPEAQPSNRLQYSFLISAVERHVRGLAEAIQCSTARGRGPYSGELSIYLRHLCGSTELREASPYLRSSAHSRIHATRGARRKINDLLVCYLVGCCQLFDRRKVSLSNWAVQGCSEAPRIARLLCPSTS